MTESPLPGRRRLRMIAVTAIPALVITGLATLTGVAPAAAAVDPPAGADVFRVTQSSSGAFTQPFLSPDGQRVAFRSTAADLVPGDSNGVADVFVSTAIVGSADPFSGTPLIVSVPDGPVGAARANGASGEPVMSADGRYVAFSSTATNLAGAPAAMGTHVYVRDTLRERTFRIEGAAAPTAPSLDPDLSDDGRYLVFTSYASNLVEGDLNGAADVFVADLDANSDGVFGDIALTKAFPGTNVETGSSSGAISGDGDRVVLLSSGGPLDDLRLSPYPSLYESDRAFSSPRQLSIDADAPSIDATGTTVAYVRHGVCASERAVVATSIDAGNEHFSVVLGIEGADTRSGDVEAPQISADASRVVWSSTVPSGDPAGGGAAPDPLAAPVIRSQEIDWWDATHYSFPCVLGLSPGAVDLAEGVDPAVSVSGRTVAYTSPDPAVVSVIDTNEGIPLTVTSTGGALVTPGYITRVDIANIPVSTLREYAGQLADAPIYRLPIYRLPIYRLPIYRLPIYRLLIEDAPIYRLPIYRLPIYRLPIYRLDLPGGWDQVLADTPFGGELIQTVTLDQVLDWATGVLDRGEPATAAERAAAEVIRSLTLQDLDIDDSGLAGLSLASYVLGGAPLADIPLAGEGAPAERWQRVVDAQGIAVTVDETTVLAELDSAGLEIDRTGIDAVALRDLPVAQTLLGEIPANRLFLANTPLGAVDPADLTVEGREALFGTVDATGTLASPSVPLLPGATAADLAAAAPASVTFGTLLFSLLDAENYPWEDISPSAIGGRYGTTASPGWGCQNNVRCMYAAQFRFTLDVGPGETLTVPGDDGLVLPASNAYIDLPAGTTPTYVYVDGSGPGPKWWNGTPYTGPVITSGERVTVPLADLRAGTILEISPWFTATTTQTRFSADAGITSGIYAASSATADNSPLSAWDDYRNNYIDGVWQGTPQVLQEGSIYYEWIAPSSIEYDSDTGTYRSGPADDTDFYLVEPPAPGKRLVVSTNATDGQIALSLYSPSGSQAMATLGIANAGATPGTAVTEQNGFGGDAEAGADAGATVVGQTLIDQVVSRGGDAVDIEAASTDAAGGEQLMLRVSSGSGEASSSLYSLRVRYVDEAPLTRCAALPAPDMGDPSRSDPVTSTTNTLYLFDSTRYAQTYGWAGADAVRAALATMNGIGPDGQEVNGAVLSLDSDAAVVAARTAFTADPCSIDAREAVTSAVNRYVASAVGDHRDQITSIVIVGGDDILPLAPVAQNTTKFTEESHAADLRRPLTADGSACPADVPAGQIDPCATPLSAAAAASNILTDDPYGLATAYESLGGYLYVPTVGLGRLVESPDQILATIARFVQDRGEMEGPGQLAADDSTTGGYGAWSELPAQVTDALEWRSSVNSGFTGTWTSQDMADRLFPDDGSASPRIVSVNTHADEKRMLPGVPGAESGSFTDTDLFTTEGRTGSDQLAGSLVFLIGCHAGNNLPTAYYGDSPDWVDVFSSAGGFVGNTGYGLANNVTTALGERLLGLYADWVGVEVDGRSITSAQALTFAKQSYLGGLGLYSGYDEKVLMGAVYYGLPMYTFAPAASGEVKAAPLPAVPAGLTDVTDRDGILSASLNLQPTFTTEVTEAGSFLTVGGEQPAAVPGQPVLPRIVSLLDPAPAGLVARGALITGLTSVREAGVTPAVTEAGVGVAQTEMTRAGRAFPSSFATVTRQDTPDGPVDLLVVTPARVEIGADGTGTVEKFTDLDLDVIYGPADSDDDDAPTLTYLGLPTAGEGTLTFRADGTGSAVRTMVLLVQREGDEQWERVDVTEADGTWTAEVPDPGSGFRWILQIVDAAGNVATETQRGHLDPAAAAAPSLGDPGEDATVAAGQRLVRTIEVTDAEPGERLTATLTVSRGADVLSSSTAPVSTDDAGRTWAYTDQVFTTPGDFVATLDVCRAASCTSTSIAVTVPTENEAPAATVTLSADASMVHPEATLTARAAGTDPDGDPVTLSYAWTRNGVPVGGDSSTLALAGIAAPGDVVTVTVSPNDGRTGGHAALASVTVVAVPAPPTIVATAATASGEYAPGSWSRSPVTVSFACTAAAGIGPDGCPAARTITADTAPEGVTVTGTVVDSLGRDALADVLVRVDRTAPVVAPAAVPSTVTVGGTVVVTPNATDAASGIVSQSCDAPDTSSPGSKTVTCRATDAAGNTATANASFTVRGPTPARCRGVADRSPLLVVNTDGSSVFPYSSGVPIVFRACDANGRSITTKGFVTGVSLVSTTSLAAGARVNELWYLPAGAFAYIKTTDTWVGQIPTYRLTSGKKYTYRVSLADGTSFTVTFGVKR